MPGRIVNIVVNNCADQLLSERQFLNAPDLDPMNFIAEPSNLLCGVPWAVIKVRVISLVPTLKEHPSYAVSGRVYGAHFDRSTSRAVMA